ncbi:hypothetical protein VP01_2139g1 [Puccinia sorghi]|uniref:Uncharacterized protein n=1 Tax=Puccinia sorghi TaxID=27349 RepID=A0A0L6V9W7_9BASI|nr:hypothetical protein VP01_2139g1 [Puccinia sorghi]
MFLFNLQPFSCSCQKCFSVSTFLFLISTVFLNFDSAFCPLQKKNYHSCFFLYLFVSYSCFLLLFFFRKLLLPSSTSVLGSFHTSVVTSSQTLDPRRETCWGRRVHPFSHVPLTDIYVAKSSYALWSLAACKFILYLQHSISIYSSYVLRPYSTALFSYTLSLLIFYALYICIFFIFILSSLCSYLTDDFLDEIPSFTTSQILFSGRNLIVNDFHHKTLFGIWKHALATVSVFSLKSILSSLGLQYIHTDMPSIFNWKFVSGKMLLSSRASYVVTSSVETPYSILSCGLQSILLGLEFKCQCNQLRIVETDLGLRGNGVGRSFSTLLSRNLKYICGRSALTNRSRLGAGQHQSRVRYGAPSTCSGVKQACFHLRGELRGPSPLRSSGQSTISARWNIIRQKSTAGCDNRLPQDSRTNPDRQTNLSHGSPPSKQSIPSQQRNYLLRSDADL